MGFKSDIEIAQECEMLPITKIAEKAGIDDKYLEQYGKYKAKLSDYEELMRTKISGIVSKYNETEVVNNKDQILEELRDALREMYNNSTFIYSVGFGDFVTQ